MINLQRRRATLYIAVLGTSLLLTVIGLSALLTTGALHRGAMGDLKLAAARLNALSAIELGLNVTQRSANWRSAQINGAWFTDRPLGGGRISLYVQDPVDGDLANSATEVVRFTGVGVVGESRFIFESDYEPIIEPLEALLSAVHSGGDLSVKSGSTLTVSGGPASTNSNAIVSGTINGNVHADSVDNPGNVNGTIRAPADEKPMPDDNVVSTFAAIATPLSARTKLEATVLSRGINPDGIPDTDGAYFLDTQGRDLPIQGIRLMGTLVISAPGKTVTINQNVLLSADRSDLPVLVIDGDLELNYGSDGGSTLDEATWGTNFNPSGAPCNNVTDADLTDSYPSRIEGLIYVTGNVTMTSTARVNGVIICEGAFSCSGTNTIAHDDQPSQTPPEGFMQSGALRLKLGTARRVLSLP